MLHTKRCTCTLGFYGGVRRNKQDVVCYAKCRHAHQQRFRFCIDHFDEPVARLTIRSDAKVKHIHNVAGVQIYRQLTNPERKEWAKEMQYRHVIDFMNEVEKNTSVDIKNDGHIQNLRSLDTAYKLKSLEKLKGRLSLESPDISDVSQLWIDKQKLADPFIKLSSLPLTVYMYREAELRTLEGEKRIILHMDATGSIVRKPQDIKCKRILYHVILTKVNTVTIKLAHMITCEQDLPSIKNFLCRYKYFVMEKSTRRKKWPIADAIVIDWSWVYIHAILEEWNQMSITRYLNIMYDYCDKGTIPPRDIIIVKSCYAHFMKNVSVTITTKFRQYKDIKKLY